MIKYKGYFYRKEAKGYTIYTLDRYKIVDVKTLKEAKEKINIFVGDPQLVINIFNDGNDHNYTV